MEDELSRYIRDPQVVIIVTGFVGVPTQQVRVMVNWEEEVHQGEDLWAVEVLWVVGVLWVEEVLQEEVVLLAEGVEGTCLQQSLSLIKNT